MENIGNDNKMMIPDCPKCKKQYNWYYWVVDIARLVCPVCGEDKLWNIKEKRFLTTAELNTLKQNYA